MKTIYGHCIHNVKKDTYVFFKDYCELAEILQQEREKIEDARNFVKCLYKGGYISEATQNNILERLK